MSKILGTRCPECGTTDAPVMDKDWFDGIGMLYCWTCPRCGHSGPGEQETTAALHAFYGEQEEEEPMDCACGGRPCEAGCPNGWVVACYECDSMTPELDTHKAAIRAWNAMQREARREP